MTATQYSGITTNTTDRPKVRLTTCNRQRKFDNRNTLVRARSWINGVKSGHTSQAGYVLVGSGRKKGIQLVSAVLGTPSVAARDAATLAILNGSFGKFQTITADNGTEFHGHRIIEETTGVPFYFAHPHHSWQRGTNENTNGLLRQYFPKGTDLARWTADEIEAVATALNSRPRKTLGYITPAAKRW